MASRTGERELQAGGQRGVDVEVVVGGADDLVDLREHGGHALRRRPRLLVAWGDPYGHLTPDQCVDLVRDWLRAAGWRPADGGERAAEICEAAGRRSAAK